MFQIAPNFYMYNTYTDICNIILVLILPQTNSLSVEGFIQDKISLQRLLVVI